MKTKKIIILIAGLLFFMPNTNFGQAPRLGTTSQFALFTATGELSNVGASTIIIGNVGTNKGAYSGFPSETVSHVADAVTVQAATDVAIAFSNLDGTTCGTIIDNILGNGQILTEGIYCQGAASTLNGDLTLNGGGNPNALFIIKIGGALTTNVNSNIILTNSASLCNVYWQITGQVILGENSNFSGTIINNGAISLLNGASLHGRALSSAGAITLQNNVVTLPDCEVGTGISSTDEGKTITIAPNPFNSFIIIDLKNIPQINKCTLRIYSNLGVMIMQKEITQQTTKLNTRNIPSGIYFYKIIESNKTILSGKLISTH